MVSRWDPAARDQIRPWPPRAGARVSFISKLGRDPLGDLARQLYVSEGIDASHVYSTASATGAAAIIIDAARGENAIVVVPGACFQLTSDEVEQARAVIHRAALFVAQLELSLSTVIFGLTLAHSLGVPTILNPAPGCKLPDTIFPLCDYLTPNETEAEILTGLRVTSLADAERAADALLARGARNVIVTLGAQGALIKNASLREHVLAVDAGPVTDTTGAGDAFNGGLAVALSEGRPLGEAVKFACAVAGLSVTQPGTAPSMPRRADVDALLGGSPGAGSAVNI